mmetsp:Transcript_17829/g.20203  ORF Transcript_17829/g.20203 Transcript_17829/m.20203 type:complete len:86 (+) Transcript_17829:135-392(+)
MNGTDRSDLLFIPFHSIPFYHDVPSHPIHSLTHSPNLPVLVYLFISISRQENKREREREIVSRIQSKRIQSSIVRSPYRVKKKQN